MNDVESADRPIDEMSLYQLTNEFERYEEALTDFCSQDKPDRNRYASDEEYENAVAVYNTVESALRDLENNLVDAIGDKIDNWAHFLHKLDDELEAARKEAKRINRIVKVRASRYERSSAFLKTCLERLSVKRVKGSLYELKVALNGGKKPVEYDGETWVRSEFAGAQYANLGKIVNKLMNEGVYNEEITKLANYFESQGMASRDALERAYLNYLTDGESERFDYDSDRVREYVKTHQELPAGFSITQKTHLKVD